MQEEAGAGIACLLDHNTLCRGDDISFNALNSGVLHAGIKSLDVCTCFIKGTCMPSACQVHASVYNLIKLFMH